MTEPNPDHFEMRRLESLSNTIFWCGDEITYGASLDGSPDKTAISAPLGNTGGAGPHLKSSPELVGIFISSAPSAVFAHAKIKTKAMNQP
jgi:hypothetical protein